MYWLIGCIAFRDAYHIVSDPRVVRLGTGGWVGMAMVSLEALVVVKFGRVQFADKALPPTVVAIWSVVLGTLTVGSIRWFGFALPAKRTKAPPAAAKAQ